MQIPVHNIDEQKLFIKWRDIIIQEAAVEHAHRHNYFQLMFLEQVKGVHEIDFKTYIAQNKSLHFVGKGRVHKVDFSTGVIGGVLLFPEELFGHSEQDLLLLSSLQYFQHDAWPVLELRSDEFNKIKDLVQKVRETISGQSFDLGKYLLYALLTQIREIYNKNTAGVETIKMALELVKYQQLLKTHLQQYNGVEDYANEIGLSVTRLNALCKGQYGLTALQLLHERKLLAAKRMLVYTDRQVKEIAYDCGFEDVAYFNRFFKKNMDCTPLAFRKNH